MSQQVSSKRTRSRAIIAPQPLLIMNHKASISCRGRFEDSRFMMRQLLEMAGHTVVEATDGEQAVRVALKEKPAIILMDLSLPKLDGLAATREIRRHKGFRHVPILAISAHDGDESRARGLRGRLRRIYDQAD
jgi:CheY-like chemotaxis protein